MVNILISGCCGKMGNAIVNCASNRNDISVVCGIDKYTNQHSYNFPVYDSFKSVTDNFDVVVDFSHPSLLNDLLEYCVSNKKACVIATTGYTDIDIENIKAASKVIPIFFTFNMSLGINLLVEISKMAAQVLGNNFDIEIIEKHHNLKIDAPSGTALMLADSINSVCDNKFDYEYNRHSKREKRTDSEIGIHSIRAGTIVGEHEVIFGGQDEVISLKHTAYSKNVLATGAINAAVFISSCSNGLYDMNDYLNSKK